jgi:hypothetical protein
VNPLVKTDTTTQGNWIGRYGSQGYNIVGNASSYPAFATVTVNGATTLTWASSTSDPRALLKVGGADRVAAAYTAHRSFTLDVNLTDGQAHYLSLYLIDWDSQGRQEQVQLVDAATQTVLDTQTISSFSGGMYLDWSIKGHVTITFSGHSHDRPVLSGIFFDPPAATATAIGRDATTQGNWIGVYGAQGYAVANSGSSYPSYAAVNWNGTPSATWSANPSDPRALRKVGGSGRIAAGWYASSSFTVNVNLLDGQAHVITFYVLDWDSVWRSERVQLVDAATGSVLDTQTVSSFHGGVYLSWQVSGNLVITVTHTGGANAVVSGLFFDPASPLTTDVMDSASTAEAPPIATPGSDARSATQIASSALPVAPAGPLAIGSLASLRTDDPDDIDPTAGVGSPTISSSSVSSPSSARARTTRAAAPRS